MNTDKQVYPLYYEAKNDKVRNVSVLKAVLLG